jgi:radical SAM family uncharacterized protein
MTHSKKGIQDERLSQESGTVSKNWRGRLRFCLVYPNRYFTGMGNLGFQSVYRLINDESDCLCERAFLPDREELTTFGSGRSPHTLKSMESGRPLADFDVIAFSISFENDYINILKVLDLSGLSLLRWQRRDSFPLVIAGGITASLNPEPISDFIDLFIVGEGEAILPAFVEQIRELKERVVEKTRLIEQLAKIEGIYAPELYHISYDQDGLIQNVAPELKIRRKALKEIGTFIPTSCVLTQDMSFGDMFLVEISRGCGRGCRFCAAGYVFRPPRHRDLELLKKVVLDGLSVRKKIGLIGPSVCDYPLLGELCQYILREGGLVSLASLRIDALTDDVLSSLAASGHKTLALAPEAGSIRLRKMIRKDFSEEQIEKAVLSLVGHGIPNLRLYFMVGLPTETLDDVKEIVTLAKRIKHYFLKASRPKGRIGRITLSISPFVPKPATPFQWVPFEEVKSLKEKIKLVKSSLKGEGNIRVVFDLPKWSFIQALLSRGDRRVGRMLLMAHHHGGDWIKAFKEVSINPDFYVYRERRIDEILPWDFIDHGFSKEMLVREYRKAIVD